MTTQMIRVIVASCLTASLLLAVGCNTFEGAGRDVETVGQKMQEVVN